MTREELDQALREIFSDMFDKPLENFDYETTPDTLEAWDSLAQVRLISAFEERFSIYIPPEDQLDMITFELVGDILFERLNA